METATPKNHCMTLSRSQQKNLDILNAAEKVFIEKGFKGTSMDEIAAVANVSKRTVYNHFETKEFLFNQILLRCCDELFYDLDLPYSIDTSLADQLTSYFNREWDIFASDRIVKLTRIVIGEYVDTPDFANVIISEIEQRETSILRWLRQAIADKRLANVDLDFAERLLIDSIKSYCHYPRIYEQELPSKEEKAFIINEIIAMFLGRYATSESDQVSS